MNKGSRKFRLHRETLHRLHEASLQNAVGGVTTTRIPTACAGDSGCFTCAASCPFCTATPNCPQ